jgi:CRP-like cAMP-binding protein
MPAQAIAGVDVNLRSPFLDGIAPSEVKIILATAIRRRYPANSVVTNQNHSADHMFLLTTGRARFFFHTYDGKKVLLLWLTPGDTFGDSALLLKPSSYIVSTETLKDSCVLAWDRATLRSLVTRFPRLLENTLLTSSRYLGFYAAAHVALISDTARKRLAGVLTCLAETIGRNTADGFEFEATNEELANAACISPFTTSRLLSEWQDNRAIVKRRGKIVLCSADRLFLHPV